MRQRLATGDVCPTCPWRQRFGAVPADADLGCASCRLVPPRPGAGAAQRNLIETSDVQGCGRTRGRYRLGRLTAGKEANRAHRKQTYTAVVSLLTFWAASHEQTRGRVTAYEPTTGLPKPLDEGAERVPRVGARVRDCRRRALGLSREGCDALVPKTGGMWATANRAAASVSTFSPTSKTSKGRQPALVECRPFTLIYIIYTGEGKPEADEINIIKGDRAISNSIAIGFPNSAGPRAIAGWV